MAKLGVNSFTYFCPTKSGSTAGAETRHHLKRLDTNVGKPRAEHSLAQWFFAEFTRWIPNNKCWEWRERATLIYIDLS